ncbi:helix-turn-helix transcriptional regulator [Pseudomonas sp. F1_0610]|uniref:AraC family transcriptional regulator n=1 Tax=Pseudomonas sp. F1_0610 TaxID=3114284 RepID=UPI0039C00659
MYNISIAKLDHTPRAIVAIGTDYNHGQVLDWHSHRRAQLLYGMTGVMHVEVAQGTWIVPPQHAVWIAADVPHKVVMLGVSTRSVYIEPEQSVRSSSCEVISVAPLLRELLCAAADLPLIYELNGRDALLAELLLAEIKAADKLSLLLPMPADEALRKSCAAFLQQPDIKQSTQQWAKKHYKSERTFIRWFKEQTGVVFSFWKQQACVTYSLALLVEGVAVTQVANLCGYDNPAAFATMFKRIMQYPPSTFILTHRT